MAKHGIRPGNLLGRAVAPIAVVPAETLVGDDMILHDRCGEPVEIHPLQVQVVGPAARVGWGSDVCWLPEGARRPVILKAREPHELVVGLLGNKGVEVKVRNPDEES